PTNTTLTATREEFATLIDNAIDKRLKALPDRGQLKQLSNDPAWGVPPSARHLANQHAGGGMLHNQRAEGGTLHADTDKIRKTFRFFSAMAQNDRETLRHMMSTYRPEYLRTLDPQIEG